MKIIIIIFTYSFVSFTELFPQDLWDVFVINEDKVFICGENGSLFNTIDGGQTWKIQKKLLGLGDIFGSIFFIDDQKGWIATLSGHILITTDSGTTWESIKIETSAVSITFYDIFFMDSLTGWICGLEHYGSMMNQWDTGRVFKTNDGGQNWNKQNTDIIQRSRFRSVYFKDSLNGWVAGEDQDTWRYDLLLKTENGGTSFSRQNADTLWRISKIYFFDQNNGWLLSHRELGWVGNSFLWSARIGSTHDAGDNWDVSDFEFDVPLNDIVFINPRVGFITADTWQFKDGGFLFSTSDSGKTWQTVLTTSNHLKSIDFADEKTGWIVGENALILKTDDGGKNWIIQDSINEIDDELINPGSFNLSQNYPNPFNPSTSIEFSLPKFEYVELKVFNILGGEVSTLVSKKLNQGNHTYTFDGKNLASGIYYYQLVVGDFREVKKMILLK